MFSIFKKLGWFFKRYKWRYTVAISLLILVSFIEVLPPKLIGLAIDDIQFGRMTEERLFELIIIFSAIILVCYMITYFWMYKLFGGAFLVERLLRSRFMRHLLQMTPTFFEKNRTGDLMARATNDLKAVSMTAGFGILTLIDSTVFLIVIVGVMILTISWELTLAALIPLPLMALLMNRYGKLIHLRFTKAQNAFGEMNDRVLESIAGVRMNRAYVQEKADMERFRHMTEDVYTKNIAVAKVDSLFEPSMKVLVGISYVIGLGYGAYLVFQSAITLGDLVAFNVYLGMLIWPMFAVGELINIMQRGNASLDRVTQTLSHAPDVYDKENSQERLQPGDIRFQHVTFHYPSSTAPVLKDISFWLLAGQTLGVVGKTGSGKSTLLKQLIREYPPAEGNISIGRSQLTDISLKQLHGWIGYVPQEQILFSRTIRENILFGKEEAMEQELHHAIRLAALDQDLALLPEGLNTLVGEKGVALSGGQKQRVSIARALLIDPAILILDDALSAVDGKTEARIIHHIRHERKGKTTLIAAHRLSAVQHADLILVLDEGRIVQSGTHDELMKHGGWYRQQFKKQQAVDVKDVRE